MDGVHNKRFAFAECEDIREFFLRQAAGFQIARKRGGSGIQHERVGLKLLQIRKEVIPTAARGRIILNAANDPIQLGNRRAQRKIERRKNNLYRLVFNGALAPIIAPIKARGRINEE